METKTPTIDIKAKIITVINKDKTILSQCSTKRANKLVKRSCAIWTGHNVITLLINDEDKKNLRKEIVEEAGRICYICGEYIPIGQYPTLDHVIPKSVLGKDVKENLKCCCKRCNDDKSNTHIVDYVEHIKGRRLEYHWITYERIRELEILINKFSV